MEGTEFAFSSVFKWSLRLARMPSSKPSPTTTGEMMSFVSEHDISSEQPSNLFYQDTSFRHAQLVLVQQFYFYGIHSKTTK
jgi:hypothetical protein